MKCPACGSEVVVRGDEREGTMYYELVDKQLSCDKGDIKVPFACQLCGAIYFSFQAVRDVVFLYPKPAPEKVGLLFLPDEDGYQGGGPKEHYRDAEAIVLSVGDGSLDMGRKFFTATKGVVAVGDRVFYHKRVPWKIKVKGPDGQEHMVVYCGVPDIIGLVQNE